MDNVKMTTKGTTPLRWRSPAVQRRYRALNRADLTMARATCTNGKAAVDVGPVATIKDLEGNAAITPSSAGVIPPSNPARRRKVCLPCFPKSSTGERGTPGHHP